MKKNVFILVLSLCISGLLMAQEPFNEEFVVPLSNPGKLGQLKVGLASGDISVVSYSGNDIIISVSQEIAKMEKKEETKNGMKKIPNYSLGLRISEEENEVHIRNSMSSMDRPLNIKVKVPKHFDLNLRCHRGDINVQNVEGEHDINTHQGDIELSDIKGSVSANSHSGDIIVSFLSISQNIPMAFTSYSGKVDVTFPSNLKMTAKLRTERGDIYTDFEMDVRRQKANVQQKENKYEVSIDSWTVGEINGGGPEFIFKNYSDDIYIRKRKD